MVSALAERRDPGVSAFASRIMEGCLSADSETVQSFQKILETLKKNGFKTVNGVSPEEVSNFMSRITSTE
jgi:hypothetical protein